MRTDLIFILCSTILTTIKFQKSCLLFSHDFVFRILHLNINILCKFSCSISEHGEARGEAYIKSSGSYIRIKSVYQRDKNCTVGMHNVSFWKRYGNICLLPNHQLSARNKMISISQRQNVTMYSITDRFL